MPLLTLLGGGHGDGVAPNAKFGGGKFSSLLYLGVSLLTILLQAGA